jgi:hypothetical protein
MRIKIKTSINRTGTFGLRERSTCQHCGRRRMTTGIWVDIMVEVNGNKGHGLPIVVGRLCDECAREVL